MKKLFFPLLLATFIAGCCKDEALPDLVVDTCDYVADLSQSNEFDVGATIDIAIRIFNYADGQAKCGTESAGENAHQLGLYRKNDQTGQFEQVGNADYLVQALASNKGFDDKPPVKLNVPGEYYVGDITDINAVVTERDENNNDNQAGQNVKAGRLTSPYKTIIIRSTPEFEQRAQSGEKFPYVEFPHTPNLIKFESTIFND